MSFQWFKSIVMALSATGLMMVSAMAEDGDAVKKDTLSLEPITVYGERDNPSKTFIIPTDTKTPSNVETYSEKGIHTFGHQGNINVFNVIEMSPSVNFTPVDQLGTNENGFHDSIRIRGKKQTGPGGIKNYDGIPISGNPGGGKTIFDMENIESVDVYKGYIPVDKSLGFSNLAGKIDLTIKRPAEKFGADLSQSFGSDHLSRSFIRLDSGEMGGFSSFGSFSYTTGDKTKGEGDLQRTNGSVGLVFKPLNSLNAECFVSHNDDEHHNYYNLSYAETQDLGKYFRKDFDTDKSSPNYYDYNRQNFKDTTLLVNIEDALTADSSMSIKPYFLNDEGNYSYTSGTNVIRWDIDHQVYGAVLKYEKRLSTALNAKLGYWAHRQEAPGPPTDQKKYTVGADGLTFAGYAVLADNDPHIIHSPFAEASGQAGLFIYSAGVRYLDLELGALKSYTNGTNAATSQDHDTAIANGTLDTWASVDARHFTEILPSAYFGFTAGPETTIYMDYTRTYGLDVNLFPTYVQQRASFVSKNVTLQSLWDKMDLEKSDNVDLGLKCRMGNINFNPNLFVSMVKNKQARVYDAEYDVTYPSNGSDAMAYGAEITVNGGITDTLDFLLSGSYNKFYFTDDLKTASNATVASDGNQVPDAPEYMAKAAVSYHMAGFTLTPSVRYLSARYGDVLNTERISDCTLMDMDISYTFEKVACAKSVVLRLTATNVFDKKYVSAINTADDALAATKTAATYQTGAPFGLYASTEFTF